MKPLTKTALTSFVAVTCLAAARVALATYSAEESGLTVAASALYGEDSGVSSDLISIVGGAINAVLSLVGTFFLILIIYSGSLWMTSRGNQEQIKRAQNTMTSAVIGIIIVMGSYTVTGFVIDQILGATGYGSDVDLVTEMQDAANRPPIDLSGCDQEFFNACLQREDMQEFEQSTRDQICQIECGAAGDATGVDNCNQEAFQDCVSQGGDVYSCGSLHKCFEEGIETTNVSDGEDTWDDPALCWATPPCNTSPYNDPSCTTKCGGSRPVNLVGGNMDSGNCINECINVHKHSISACEASCSTSRYNNCIDDCISSGGNSTDCGTSCQDKAPTANPTGIAGQFDDCVAQCTNDEDTSLSQTQCERQCTGVEADNPLVDDTCYADCFASNPSVFGVDLNFDSTTYYCNKVCLNPEVVNATVNNDCWNSYPNMEQKDRLKACMLDEACWEVCLDNQNTEAQCIDDCRLALYD